MYLHYPLNITVQAANSSLMANTTTIIGNTTSFEPHSVPEMMSSMPSLLIVFLVWAGIIAGLKCALLIRMCCTSSNTEESEQSQATDQRDEPIEPDNMAFYDKLSEMLRLFSTRYDAGNIQLIERAEQPQQQASLEFGESLPPYSNEAKPPAYVA